MAISMKSHWNKKYTDASITQLGWYESKPIPSIQLIENCAIPKHFSIVDVGSGASTLLANLLELGYQNIFAIDISDVALEKAKTLLNKEQEAKVHWIVDDITNPSLAIHLQNIAVWHDRAVLHFLTDKYARQTYHSLVQKVVITGGFVVISTFALEGATHCSGLPVQRYSVNSLSNFFGDGFKLLESLNYTYQMPSGDLRPYVYARFQKL